MQRIETVKRILYYSKIHPELVTDYAPHGDVIDWADANPVVWKIVRGVKSHLFGRNGQQYLGCERNDSPGSVIARAATFKREIEREGSTLFGWRARFTMAHYGEKGFKSGFFQQNDGTYMRGCSYLDYTPATLDEVVKRFLAWCDAFKFPTKEVYLDKKVIRTFESKERKAV